MTKLKATSVFGNFRWNGECEVGESELERLAGLGLLQIMQRGPSSTAEKTLAGYVKRPEGFKRNSIPFSEENAKVVKDAFSTVTLEADEENALPELKVKFDITVEKYVPPTADPKFTEEKTIVGNHVSKGDLTEWAKAKGLGDVPEKPLEDKEFLAKVREVKKATLAAM